MSRPIPEPLPVDPGAQVLIDRVRSQMEVQPWYQRFSNTATTAAGAALLALWCAASFGLDVPEDVSNPVYVGIGLLTVLGVLKTPNGTTPSTVANLKELAPTPGETPGSL